MKTRHLLVPALLLVPFASVHAQHTDAQKDSIYIQQIEEEQGPHKVLHAEPLYIDLIRDLGARKGEKEWNFGMGLTDKRRYDEYEFLVEYEFAPIDRLGLEIEVPFSIVAPRLGDTPADAPASRMESIKVAAQWSFLVSRKLQASFALGYINEFLLSDFRNFGRPVFTGNLFNPFLIAAKRIGNNFHTLVYTGPHIEVPFDGSKAHFQYEIHTNFHYMIRGTRNFIGVEVNKYIDNGRLDMTIRPQMRVGIADNFLIGIVTGIPVGNTDTGLSMFTRVIWEPGHRHK